MMNLRLLLIGFLLSVFCSCKIHKEISIFPDRKNKDELKMYINPAIKRGGIGVLLIVTVGIYVEIPELIKEITIRDSEGEILWQISALNQEFGAHSVLYGVLNKKEYIQEVPLSGSPIPLIRNNSYSLELTTVKASYRTSFLFHESKVFLTEKDKIENRNF